jgi:hypothetical protein
MLRATISNKPMRVPFTMSLIMEAVSRRKPASAGTTHNNFCALGDQKNTFYVIVAESNYGFI